MKIVYELTLDEACELFRLLDRDCYSSLWHIIDDFIVNGHYVSVKSSAQFYHAVIDGCYHRIGGKNCRVNGFEPLEYAIRLIRDTVGPCKVGTRVVRGFKYGKTGTVRVVWPDGRIDVEWDDGSDSFGLDHDEVRVETNGKPHDEVRSN